jgi:DNA-binding response OmpR family regulator
VQDDVVSEMQVLVVDDEPMVREVLALYLERDGYEVLTAEDGAQALERFDPIETGLVLLDLMLPRVDGLEVFTELRRLSSVPVIMLTARGAETDRIVGLDMGADDYVTKPFSPREVVSRVRAVMRRSEGGADAGAGGILRFGELAIDVERREATIADEPARLTRKEFDLLEFMASHPSMTFSRVQLLEEVWDFAWDGDPSTVTVHVRRLREKIERDPSVPVRLLTVWGVGYRFEP